MTDADGEACEGGHAVAKKQWQTPTLDVLPVNATFNNGLVAPGDGTFSPSPTGS